MSEQFEVVHIEAADVAKVTAYVDPNGVALKAPEDSFHVVVETVDGYILQSKIGFMFEETAAHSKRIVAARGWVARDQYEEIGKASDLDVENDEEDMAGEEYFAQREAAAVAGAWGASF